MTASAFVPPPVACERLRDILPRFDGTHELLPQAGAGERYIGYPLPAHASTEMKEFLKPLMMLEPEPDFVARLPGGRVFGPGAVLSPDGRSLARDISTDFGKPFDQHWLLTYAKMRPPVRVAGATAVVAVTLGEGYCHWLLEELPRLLALDGRDTGTVIAHTGALFIREALESGRFHKTRFLEATRYSHFECDQLIIPGLVGRPGYPTPRVVRLLEEFSGPLHEPAGTWGERLYITREKAGRRRVSNEAELWRRLEGGGFTKLRLEELSWKDQINAFSHAKVIVAPHGAGLANLVFCRPGVRVVECFNRSYVNPCFGRLAGLGGLDYRPLVSAGSEPLACDPQANRRDVCADIAGIMDALIEM
ncbi:MAG: hypothetical protein K0R17_640 [Rariglobus sp.]|jgi:hypothetical protein|nr:hypothetical protein [Rariglobus sp.]